MILPTHIVASGGLIFNNEDKVLLVKNPRKGWEYPGGIIEPGETVPKGLMREIKEETGVDVEIIDFVGIYSSTKKKKGYNGVNEVPTIVNIDFVCKYISGDLRTSPESIEVKWVSQEEALNMINKKQQYRLQNALNYKSAFYCSGGYAINSNTDIHINEEYSFTR